MSRHVSRQERPSCNSMVAVFDRYLDRSAKRIVHKRLEEAALRIEKPAWEINPLRVLPGGIYVDPGYVSTPKEWLWKDRLPSMQWAAGQLVIHGGWRPYRDAMVLEAQIMGARIIDTGCSMRPVQGIEPKPWMPQEAFGA